MLDVALLLAVLTLASQVGLACLGGAALLAPVSAIGRRVLTGLRLTLGGREITLAWIVAATAIAGSLYFSEIAGFPPCPLCWYQRIFMYPLALLLAVAAVRAHAAVAAYVLPLALAGGAFSIYHYQLQLFPRQASGFCSAEAPCDVRWAWEFGYVSIPLMALTAFVVIAVLVVFASAPPPQPQGGQPWVDKRD